jgi:hypothetical protein
MGKFRDLMSEPIRVKTRLPTLVALVISLATAPLRGEETPDAHEILKIVRGAQTAQNRTLQGRLRTGPKAVPFQLTMSDGTVRWQFADPPQTLLLRLGERDARLEEIGKNGPQKITPARADDKVRDSDISYEDLAMRFLYWPDAVVEGDQRMIMQPCWIIRVQPPAKAGSQYRRVKLWIAKETGALMQAEAFGADDKLARRFKVISGQKTPDGLWILKQMRIESPGATERKDRTPTYLEIEKPD